MQEAADLAQRCTAPPHFSSNRRIRSIPAAARALVSAARSRSDGARLRVLMCVPDSSVEVSPSGSPSSRALSNRRMILPLRVRGSVVDELDLLRRDDRAKPRTREAQQLAPQRIVRLEAVLQGDERLDDLTGDRVGLADHAGLGDRRVLHQRALDLEGPDQVAGRLDHVVRAARRTSSSRPHRGGRGRRSGTSRRQSNSRTARARPSTRGTSRASRAAAPARPSTSGSRRSPRRHRRRPLHDGRLDAGQRAAHRAGTDVHRGDSWRS